MVEYTKWRIFFSFIFFFTTFVDSFQNKHRFNDDILITFKNTVHIHNQLFLAVQHQNFSSTNTKIKYTIDQLKHQSFEQYKSCLSPIFPGWDIFTLENPKSSLQLLWLSNQFFIKNATMELITLLEQLDCIQEIHQDEKWKVEEEIHVSNQSSRRLLSYYNSRWGIEKIQAKKVWKRGTYGSRVTIGFIDTGLNAAHLLFSPKGYRLKGWHDAVNNKSHPYDDASHGTMVAGIALGKNGIGVAPHASYIMCKGLHHTGKYYTHTSILRCAQYLLCPDDDKCDNHPDIITNSWTSNLDTFNMYEEIIRLWRLAGIIPVFASGNNYQVVDQSDPITCKHMQVQSPSNSHQVITVGSISRKDRLSPFSRRAEYLKEGIIDFVAPGEDIISSTAPTSKSFAKSSGTSFAAPYVSGTIALMISEARKYDKHAILSFDEIYEILRKTAISSKLKLPHYRCGRENELGKKRLKFPNGIFGHGLINANEAVKEIERRYKH